MTQTQNKSNTRNTSNTVDAVAVINNALSLLHGDSIRLHQDATLDTIHFRNAASTFAQYNIAAKNPSIRTVASRIPSESYANEFSVTITGLLALSLAQLTNNDVSLSDVQGNALAADTWFATAGFDAGNLALAEYAYYPWTALESDITADEAAASNYQRRIRKGARTQTAYKNLVKQILLNMRTNGGNFRPSRDDYRATTKAE